MGFKAAEAVEALDWDFTKYGGGSGTSPEPSTADIHQYQRSLRSLVGALQRLQTAEIFADSDELTGDELKEQMRQWRGLSLDEAMARIDQEQQDALVKLGEAGDPTTLDNKICELVARTLGQCPNQTQIQTLPHRVRFAYYGWVTEELLNPELVAAGMKPSLSLVRNA